MATDLQYPLYSTFAFIGFVVSLIPLPWHLQAWNSGTCYYMLWSALACLNQFVNSVAWHGTVLNFAPVWCDISIRIMLGASVGIPAASLCINRRLYHIAKCHAVVITRAEKRRAVLIDTLICVLFPAVFIALQYVVQGHRFDIYEDVGCYPFIYNTIVAFFLSDSWPIVIGLISAVYCGLSLRAFYRRRAQFNKFLASNTSLNASRYFRLMAIAMLEILCTVPLASFMIWLNATAQPVEPWVSWQNTHYDFSRVAQYPSVVWTQNYLLVVAVQLSRWFVVVCAFIFFGFFGFAAEARKHYCMAFWSVMKLFDVQPSTGETTSPKSHPVLRQLMLSHGSLPVYTPKHHMSVRRNSLSSSITHPSEKSPSMLASTLESPLAYDDLNKDVGGACAV
ncbi:pheromone A receptor-domain-containing protein [Phlebopus sp. FC_14]|nr:pheromone A receptor-domain-containing protein [Phlebopus sp. FC_14]